MSSTSTPRRVSIFISRSITDCSSACSSSSVGEAASMKAGEPSTPRRYTPSSTKQCRWMLRLAADPKRWISVTAPLWPSSALSPAAPSRWRVSTRCTTCSTGVTSSGCAASSTRSGIGSDSTHCRTGTWGMTWSIRCAAVCGIRRAPHDGQKPRRFQLNASSLSWPHSPQRSLRKPRAWMPQSRKASNSSLMNRGNSAPVLASVWAMKLAACCCTRRYSVVCSGRWRL